MSGIMRRMDEEWALACYVFGSTCRNSRVQFELVLLFLMCVDQVCGIHEVMRGLYGVSLLSSISSPIRLSILVSICRVIAGGVSL